MSLQPPRKKANRTLLIVLSAVLGVLVLCVGAAVIAGLAQGDGKQSSQANPAATTASPASTDAYLKALDSIDPALAAKRTAVNDGNNICLDIKQGKDDATVARNTAARFSVDTAKATQIVAAARQHLCPA